MDEKVTVKLYFTSILQQKWHRKKWVVFGPKNVGHDRQTKLTVYWANSTEHCHVVRDCMSHN